jgi:enoyl-CoA hydratase
LSYIEWFLEESVATIKIDRPPANALSLELLKDTSCILDELEQRKDVRVILLHGKGRFFSAGADIKEFTNLKTKQAFVQLAEYGQRLFERIETFPKPVIAVIHGAALGGGLELAMACHFRLVSENAKLGLPELQLGVLPGFAGSQRLPKLVGVARAAEMLFTSSPISGLEAVKYGLANHAFPEDRLFEESYQIAQKIAAKSPISLKWAIELLNYAKTSAYHEGVKREAELFGEIFMTDDAKEGISAFIEKREPHFSGD